MPSNGKASRRSPNLLQGARVYLSGPMDFVASREAEAKEGWRTRIGRVLRELGVVVFDPWNKPEARGLHGYGRETAESARIREKWTFEDSPAGARTRAKLTGHYWETLHIDLRMVDTSDFTISYCPTNIYSVGTPHEIIMATLQHKPVLFVSPPIVFPALAELREHLRNDPAGRVMLERLELELPIKENPLGIPSLWYIPLVGGENFFDGFGFAPYRKRFGWKEEIPIDRHERRFPPQRPLLPFVEKLNHRLPRKWDGKLNRFVADDDWLLWDFNTRKIRGKHVESVRKAPAQGKRRT